MARQIHRFSARANKPFIELNCANLPEQLVEAELFGHRKGAFTGGDYDRKGLFEEADGGVLFLDEIGDVPLTIQNRLLKAIEEKQIKRLGTNHYRLCDVQIIAATSRNLSKMIQDNGFREDLYCRLAILTVEASPLRERREDIPAMVSRFLLEATYAVHSSHKQIEPYRIDEDALEKLCGINYPGNIRSLRNLIYTLTSYLVGAETISIELVKSALARLPSGRGEYLFGARGDQCSAVETTELSAEFLLNLIVNEGDIILPLELCVLRREETFKQWTARAKRCSIEAAREATGGTMQTVAQRLGLTHSSLKSHLQRARAQTEPLFEWQRVRD